MKAFGRCTIRRTRLVELESSNEEMMNESMNKVMTIKNDLGNIQLTLGAIASLLNVELGAELRGDENRTFAFLSHSFLTSGANSIHFGKFSSEYSPDVQALIDKGTTAFVTNRQLQDSNGGQLPCLVVDDPREAFVLCCSFISSQYSAKRIALTGSVGKTTTKEMVQLVVSNSFKTLYSKGNQNGIAQIGRYVQRLTDSTEVYVQETGAGRPGLVDRGARVLHPDAFIITNIGLNHIGNYGGSQEALLEDKLSLDRYLPADGVAFVNYDDEKLREIELKHRIISYSIEDSESNYFAEDILERDGKITFMAVESSSGIRVTLTVNAFGRHNVSNALVAFAVGRWLGVPIKAIEEGIASYRGEGLRQNLMEVDGRKILVDCYNASEVAIASTAGALETITVGNRGQRVYVVGDIDDKLGEVTEEVHRRVGIELGGRSRIDRLVLFGDHMAWAADEARKLGANVFHTADRSVLNEHIKSTCTENDVVAFKGGQQMALSITIDALYGTSLILLDGDVLRTRGRARFRDLIEYRTIDEYGVELRRRSKDFEATQVVVRSAVNFQPVHLIGQLAFHNSDITAIAIPEPVRTIGVSAFYRAKKLRQVILPTSLRLIDRSAFNSCSSLTELSIPEGVTTIGKRAFFACRNLSTLKLPSSIKTIDPEAFDKCPKLKIVCVKGSYAEQKIRSTWPELKVETIA